MYHLYAHVSIEINIDFLLHFTSSHFSGYYIYFSHVLSFIIKYYSANLSLLAHAHPTLSYSTGRADDISFFDYSCEKSIIFDYS